MSEPQHALHGHGLSLGNGSTAFPLSIHLAHMDNSSLDDTSVLSSAIVEKYDEALIWYVTPTILFKVANTSLTVERGKLL